MSRYVEVPAARMIEFLESKGFTPVETKYRELVYERVHHRSPNLRVRVFTSIAKGSSVARECGADAIRVALVWVMPTFSKGLESETKVLRTGSVDRVLERLLERMKDAYRAGLRLLLCPKCKSPVWTDSGKCQNRECDGFVPRSEVYRYQSFIARQRAKEGVT